MAVLRIIGRTEALASCMAKRCASSSDTWVGVIWVSPVEPILIKIEFFKETKGWRRWKEKKWRGYENTEKEVAKWCYIWWSAQPPCGWSLLSTWCPNVFFLELTPYLFFYIFFLVLFAKLFFFNLFQGRLLEHDVLCQAGRFIKLLYHRL